MSSEALWQAIDEHDLWLVELANPCITRERVEEITKQAIACYDLLDYSAEVCDLNGEVARELQHVNRKVHEALTAHHLEIRTTSIPITVDNLPEGQWWSLDKVREVYASWTREEIEAIEVIETLGRYLEGV